MAKKTDVPANDIAPSVAATSVAATSIAATTGAAAIDTDATYTAMAHLIRSGADPEPFFELFGVDSRVELVRKRTNLNSGRAQRAKTDALWRALPPLGRFPWEPKGRKGRKKLDAAKIAASIDAAKTPEQAMAALLAIADKRGVTPSPTPA